MKNLKTICASAFALGLCLAVPPAMAQPDQDQDQQHQGGGHHGGHGGHDDNNNDHAGHHGDNGGGGGNDNDNNNNHHGGGGGNDNDNHHAGNNDHHGAHDRNVDVHRNVTVHRHVTVDKVVRERINRRPDVIKIRANVHAPRRFHWRAYVHPAGWYAHRWVYNEVLPIAFYASDYWITDYGQFGLVIPPPGFVWVRVGDDALLIDRETGLIVRVVYDVFY